ncbi:MAG: serine/threonine protein kinase [Acutalibacteraceae bacterium]
MNKNARIVVQEEIQNFEILDFIALGGESIVFKGRKTATQRPYALKFRNRERIDEFNDGELQVLSRLYDCSVGKIEGIIDNIPQDIFWQIYNRIPPDELKRRNEAQSKKGGEKIDPYAEYFCIIEDYIPGCDLAKYCRTKRLTPKLNAPYREVLEFQRKLLDWTVQFCEIMKNVTGKNHILHLDIKPENIMIMNETEAVVLIDFGMSIPLPDNYTYVDIGSIYEEDVLYEKEACYGTRSFAAPECCYSKSMRSIYNNHTPTGRVDERSDIFSFGATLWDCINTQGDSLRIRESEDGYFRRDLFNTPMGYTEEFENIIIKCTEKDPDKRFQSFGELKKAAQTALKKMPRTYGKNKTSLGFVAAAITLTVIASVLGGVTLRYNNLVFEAAKYNFEDFDRSENTSVSKFADVAIKYAEANKNYNGNAKEVYEAIIEKTYSNEDGTIDKNECEKVLIKCLDYANDDADICDLYANEIIKRLPNNENAIGSITALINTEERFKTGNKNCDGWKLAHAYQECREYTNLKDAYETVLSFASETEDYKVILKYLIKNLNEASKEVADAVKYDRNINSAWLDAKDEEDEEGMKKALIEIEDGIKKKLENLHRRVTGEELNK